MQLVKVTSSDRPQLARLIINLKEFNIPFIWEWSNGHLGKESNLYLISKSRLPDFFLKNNLANPERTEEFSIFNPTGIHLIKHLRPKSPVGLLASVKEIFLEKPEVSDWGEGYSVQYHWQPKRGLNVSVVTSAFNFLRANAILNQLSRPFRKDFRLAAPADKNQSLADFSFRIFNEKEKFTLADDQFVNLLPIIQEPRDFKGLSPISLFDPLRQSASEASDFPLKDELKKIIEGELLIDNISLEHYSTDGSIFKMKPWAVVLPKNKNDLVNLVKWVSQKKSEISKIHEVRETHETHETHETQLPNFLSLTCRGKATDQAGGPLNEGIIVRFPQCLDKILEIGSDFIRMEPGVIWSAMNDQLAKTDRFVPCYPASAKFATIGGGVANNCSGEKTIKYGSTRDYVLSLKMILADGQEVEFSQLNEEKIKQKQAQTDLEGEIYRRMWDLLIANHNLIENSRLNVNKSSTGYWLYDVLTDGGMDLTRLICGSQGTFGIITEIKLKTIPRPKATGLLLASFADLASAGAIIFDLLQLRPSALEMVDKFLLEMVLKSQPEKIKNLDLKAESLPAIILFIEFDNHEADVKTKISQAKEKLKDLATELREAYELAEQDELWEIRRSAAIVAESAQGKKKALPFIEDVTVHPKHFGQYLQNLYQIMKKYNVEFSVWGHAGNGNIHIQPFLDLSEPADREKLFKIAEEVYAKVISLRGAISGEHNDGLMRAPFLKDQFGEPMMKVFTEVKNIFDPQNIFNPNKKVDVDLEFIKKRLREEYEIHIGGQST